MIGLGMEQELNNWIGSTLKQLWNYAIYVMLKFLGFNNKTTAWGDTAFIPYYLKSSMALVNYSRGSVCLAFPFQD